MDRNGIQIREHAYGSQHSLISWKSIFAGLFVAMITYVTLTALGAGIGGASASGAIQDRNAGGLAAGAGIWMAVTTLLSLMAGSYFAARTSTFITGRVGAAQGLIIAGLFFTFMIYGVGKTLGAAGRGLGNMVGVVSTGVGDLASDPTVQNTIQKALGDANLKSEPSVVAQNVATYLIRGDEDAARNYLAYQTGLSSFEINARLAGIKAEFTTKMQEVGMKTAEAVSAAGWTLFATLLLGIGSSVIGGALGSRANFRQPLTDDQVGGQILHHTVAS